MSQTKKKLDWIINHMSWDSPSEHIDQRIARLFTDEGQERYDEIAALIIKANQQEELLRFAPFLAGYSVFLYQWIVQWASTFDSFIVGGIVWFNAWLVLQVMKVYRSR